MFLEGRNIRLNIQPAPPVAIIVKGFGRSLVSLSGQVLAEVFTGARQVWTVARISVDDLLPAAPEDQRLVPQPGLFFSSCGARRMVESAALEDIGVQTPFLKVGDDMVSQAGCGQ
jgi:hypothetical protein